MAYDSTKPANNGYLAEFPPEMREQLRALKEDAIVNAGTVNGLTTGNSSGNIPVSNGNVNTNLNADKVDGYDASAFAMVSHTHSAATTSSNGFMSNTDKAKLDSIATGAEVNQNAFSNVLVGSTTIQADSTTDTLELVAGANISLTPDAVNDRVTINCTYTHPTGDGNLHVPATGTSNNGKVLKAGSTAGSVSWGTLSATDIINTASGNISSTTVQDAINELDAEKVNVSDVVTTATANKILKLDANAKLPASITGDAATVGGKSPGTSANNVLVLDASGKVPQGNLPNIPSANLPIASASTLGGVKVGSNLDIDANGTVALTNIKPLLNASGSAPIYACRAWVNFDGTATPPTIRASGNVSSVVRNSTGIYTVNFTIAMPHTNYTCVFGGRNYNDGNGGWLSEYGDPSTQGGKTLNSIVVLNCTIGSGGGNISNISTFNLAVFC